MEFHHRTAGCFEMEIGDGDAAGNTLQQLADYITYKSRGIAGSAHELIEMHLDMALCFAHGLAFYFKFLYHCKLLIE